LEGNTIAASWLVLAFLLGKQPGLVLNAYYPNEQVLAISLFLFKDNYRSGLCYRRSGVTEE